MFKKISLSSWILIAMVVGTLVGWQFPGAADGAKVLSNLFLRMIKLLVVPLILSTLVTGIAGHGDDMKKVGRLAWRSILYFEIVTTLALVVGLVVVNLVQPGLGVDLSTASAEEGAKFASNKVTLSGVLEHTIPTSFFDAAAHNEVLQIVFFSVLFSAGLATIPQSRGKDTLLAFFEGIVEVMFKFTGYVMSFAPIGIAGAIAYTVGKSGLGVLLSLGKLVLALYGALVIFIVLVLVPVAMIAKVPLREFFRKVREPWLLAFSTASSEAALPIAMKRMEEFGVPKRIIAFVMPTGYSFNLDGSTLYLAMASVFAAQAAGVEMSVGQQVVMMLTLMLTSKGVAAVPRASLVILSGTLTMFGLPLEAVAVILGVDALMDMARTSVNLLGNCLATVVMARWEGEFSPPAADRA
ncbi:MAG: dicarboxylate/amino acid:cation symporter [Gemmatimonadaceae bacterium]|nr:dicarboxylate/amino acid:cation symporter [Gemmatimonadaceae bacterium]